MGGLPDSLEVDSLLQQAYLVARSSPDSSLKLAKSALSLSLLRRDFVQIAESHRYVAEAYWDMRSFSEALHEFSIAYWYYRLVHDDYSIALILQQMSRIYSMKGRYEDARITLEEAIHICEGLQKPALLSRLFHAMGNLYHELEQDERAIDYHRQSLRINRERNHPEAISANLINLGNVFWGLEEVDSSLFYYRAALAQKLELGDARGIVIAESNIGNALIKVDSLEKSEAILLHAISYGRANDLEPYVIYPRINLAENYSRCGRYEEAIQLLLDLKADSALMGLRDWMVIMEGLAFSYEATGQYKLANENLRLYHALDDSINGLEAASAILGMEEQLVTRRQARSLAALQAQREVQSIRLKNKTLWLYLLLSIALLVALLAGLIFLRYRIQNRASKRQAALNKMRSRFFANISHEFKTPIGLILGPLSRLLQDPNLDPQTRDWLNISHRNGQQLLELTHQLLDLSRLEVGKMPLRLAETHLAPLFQNILGSFKPLADQHNISLDSSLPELGWWAIVDQQALFKIANNLLSNAIRHTPEGGAIELTISIHPIGENGEMRHDQAFQANLRIAIADTGEGIPEDQIRDIFRPFYQADSKRNQQGAGIGLNLVKELVELQDGSIQVESKLGEGTTFRIEMPVLVLWKAEEEVSEAEMDQLDLPADAPLVLVVDDNADFRKLLHEELKGGFRILEGKDGATALRLAQNNPVELVVSDYMMPEMNGIGLCRALKAGLETSHIPFVLLTGFTDDAARLEALSAGVEAYLNKPFPNGELHIRVRNLIEQRRTLRQQWSQEPEAPIEHIAGTDLDKDLLQKARKVVQGHLSDSDFDVQVFCKEMGMSRPQLFRKLKAVTGQNISEFIRAIRLREAAVLLQNPSVQVSDVAYRVGFSNPSYFSRSFRQLYGQSPKEYAGR